MEYVILNLKTFRIVNSKMKKKIRFIKYWKLLFLKYKSFRVINLKT